MHQLRHNERLHSDHQHLHGDRLHNNPSRVHPSLLSLPLAPLTRFSPYLPRNTRVIEPLQSYVFNSMIGPASQHSAGGEPLPSLESSEQTWNSIQEILHPTVAEPSIGSVCGESLIDSTHTFSFVKRISSFRLPYDQTPMAAPKMSKYLGMELENTEAVEVPDLVERLYPDTALPFSITTDILSHPEMAMFWNKSKKAWKFSEVYDEVEFSNIMNNIALGIGRVFNKHRQRIWTARLRDCSPKFREPLKDNPPYRLKPDLVLIPRSAIIDADHPDTLVLRQIYWDIIRSVAEITKSKVMPVRTKETMNNKSYVLMLTQPERNFVPFLTIYSQRPQRLYFRVTDRDGQVYSDFRFSDGGEVNALRFIRIITAFAFGDTKLHGRDPTIVQNSQGTVITAGGVDYCDAKLLHSSQSMIGRCTRVWSAEHPETGIRVIIKDGWLHHTRATSESKYLRLLQAAGVSGIPTIVWDGAVGSGGDESTLTIRRGFFSEQDYRIHHRIVMTPCGVPLTMFSSLAELINALKDIAVAHQACIANDVLHSDISLNNIILVNQPGQKYKAGYLIDFDYASLCSSKDSVGEQTGTMPFMAIEMLMKTSAKRSVNSSDIFVHSAKHDLESLFYVLLYISTLYSGPQQKLGAAELRQAHTSVPILEWVEPDAFQKSFRSMGRLKISHLSTFRQSIIAKISPFFRPIEPGLFLLKDAIFPFDGEDTYFNNKITHNAMIDIFDLIIADINAPPRKKLRSTSDADTLA